MSKYWPAGFPRRFFYDRISLMKKKIIGVLKFIPMIAVMAIIFLFSAMQGDDSSETSGFFLKALAGLVEEISHHGISDKAMGTLHFLIRKAAHFSEYAVLGATTLFAIRDFLKKKWKMIAFPEIVSFLYACTDEIHQRLVPGRYGTFSDVLIDSCGAVTGILIFLLILETRKKKKSICRENK